MSDFDTGSIYLARLEASLAEPDDLSCSDSLDCLFCSGCKFLEGGQQRVCSLTGELVDCGPRPDELPV